MKTRPILPPVTELTKRQHDGWACVWCYAPLRHGAVSAGRAEGLIGSTPYSVEVYACPACAAARGLG
ncbi:hypothetical protein [Streptomyces sp. NPDC059786]|uniref:hypothetical protein n=1 Tax=Streptomyces sp. NPDC059786 TaxID=3346946 RepID=UPI003656A9D4